MLKNHTHIPAEQTSKPVLQSQGLDPLLILNLLKDNWYYFVISIIIAFLVARFYITHTMPVHRTSATILINEGEDRSLVNNEELLQGLGLPGSQRNLDNQTMVLTSRDLTGRALRELPFEIEYYHKTVKNDIPIYPDIPVKVVSDGEIPLPRDTEFSIVNLGNNTFSIECETDDFFLNKKATFGENIEIPGGNFRILNLNEDWFNSYRDQKLYFTIHDPIKLTRYFNRRLEVELLSRNGSILEISITGTNRAKDVDFLNKLLEVFQSISLDKKNTEALRRIQFIDDQLVGISDSLLLTENKLQQFRSTNRVMDVSAQGQAIIGQVTLLENERARLNLESNYFDYLADYLAKDQTGAIPIVPITMGISDPGLTRLVTELAELQEQLSTRGAGEMNPLQNLLSQKVKSTKAALVETLNGLRRANSLARHENETQINNINKQASALPITERQLLGIERKFRLNDELYTFLLETRAEQQMQKASNMADSEVIDSADEMFSMVVAPNPTKIYFVGMFAGFGLPFIFLFLIFLFNKKLKEEDVKRITDVPIVGNIPRSTENTSTVVFDNPNSSLAEAYRLMRSRMQFFTKEANPPVILVTSSMPGDGKTFTSINLASVYSLLGKKTVLVGFDLRKPGIYKDFNLQNEKGVSTWLIGQDRLENIIQKTGYDNLSIITAGPIPPNPSELIALEKTNELINLLKEKFDYIIIDTSPIGFISDTFHLASLADACILVVRPGKTLRDMFETTLSNISGTKGLSLVINDLQTENTQYVYGDKYGYTSDKKKQKKKAANEKIA